MPGRQAHGRPLTFKSAAKPAKAPKKSKSKLQAHALDAYAIAAKQFPTKEKRTPRFRQLEPEIVSRKRDRDQQSDEEDDGGEEEDLDGDEAPRRKRSRPLAPGGEDDDDDAELHSDSDGNEWRVGVDPDNDSEIDSDEAFGESDDERYESMKLGKGKGKALADEEEDLDEEGEDDDSLGDDAIDLAQVLDDQTDDESMGDGGESGSDEDESSPPSSDDEDEEEEDDDDHQDSSKGEALQDLVAKYAQKSGKDDAGTFAPKQKVSLQDLGLAGVKDANIRKSVKIMSKEDKEGDSGAAKSKLSVPLARRQQDKLVRAAAYEKTTETLERWTETVARNRRAEHLVFPLPQTLPNAGLDNSEIRALTEKSATNELEQTIMSIMEQSGLAVKEKKPRPEEEQNVDVKGLSKSDLKALWSDRRRERELNSRETQRAKRIKKIKSKAYHRIHRKARQKDEIKLKEAMEEAGEINSEDEREAHDRKRALERVGAKHRDSKWAKSGSQTKRAVWDDDFRAGLHEMAQREDELRKRKEGKTVTADSDDEDEDEDDTSDPDGEGKARLLRQLQRVAESGEGPPESGLMQLKFMKRAEDALKKMNDEELARIRKELASDDEDGEEEEDEADDVITGRKSYGMGKAESKKLFGTRQGHGRVAGREEDGQGTPKATSRGSIAKSGLSLSAPVANVPTEDATGGAWSRGEARRKNKKKDAAAAGRTEVLDLNASIIVAEPAARKARAKASFEDGSTIVDPASKEDDAGDDDDEEEAHANLHLPLAIRDQALVARAFAGEDVVGEFEREKAEVAVEDDDKVVDETLPGWGSWIGEGVSARELAKGKGRWMKRVEGVKKAKDRRDAKLERVIISEKTAKKNTRYLASQLPHPYESAGQYERSLRLPVGQEWMTKQTFGEATKPRVIVKQGVITPIARPIL